MSHIRKDHPNFKEELHKNFAFGTPGVTKKVLNYSRWFEWTIMEKREFGFCENFQVQNLRTWSQYRITPCKNISHLLPEPNNRKISNLLSLPDSEVFSQI